ncbi:MAG TPA: hypothetical protein VFB07_03845 [Vicinamibacterales bacterium]|nr:hypothetical protein [Vicinamibacterales bacterium]
MTAVGRGVPAAPARPARSAALRALGLCAIAIAAYANSFAAGFAFDSRALILQDPRVHAATADNVDLILRHTYWWPYGESGLYRPATTLSYLFNYAVLGGGERPFGYHAFNLAVHLLNVLLVWMLVADVAERDEAALAAAAMWAVLPVSVEAVTNIVGRADLLAALGVLAGVWLYGRACDRDGRVRPLAIAGLVVATAVAVLSKESGVVLAPIVVCCELCRWRRKTSPRALLIAAGAMAAPLAIAFAARSAVLGAAPPAEFPFVDNPIVGATWIVARLTAAKAAGMYLWKLAWPARLSADYSFAAIPLAGGAPQDWLAWATLAATAGAIAYASRRSRAAAFFGLFAIVAFLPVSNLLFASGTIFGERLLYLPSAGLVALAALLLSRLRRAAFITLASLVVVVLAGRTWARNPDWASDITLWRAAVAAEPQSAKAHHALAEALYDAEPSHGNIDAVIAEQQRAIAILDPLPDGLNWFQAYRQAGAYHLDKATALAAEGRPEYEAALTRLRRAKSIYDAGARRYGASANAAAEADLDRLLAAAYLGVHDADGAYTAAARARDLEPLAPLAYREAATAQLARQEPDAAAITLMAGSMVTADRGLTQALLGLYAAGLDERGCATTTSAAGPALNTSCGVVQRHLCAAAPEAARLDRQLGRFTEAERVESTARTISGCGR